MQKTSICPTNKWGVVICRSHTLKPLSNSYQFLPSQQGWSATSSVNQRRLDGAIARWDKPVRRRQVELGRFNLVARISTISSANASWISVQSLAQAADLQGKKRIDGCAQRKLWLNASKGRISHQVLGETLADHSKLLWRAQKCSHDMVYVSSSKSLAEEYSPS